jgi:hypothetical protein
MRNGRWSARGLLQHYDHMVIPHFQRGLVWDEASVALLLESLYFGTPCGSIIFWRPEGPAQHGVPLGSRPKDLIIDGQQRIRSLREVFGPTEDFELDPDPNAEATLRRVWCVNLACLEEFENQFENRFRLFGRHRDPLKEVADEVEARDLGLRKALVPLRWLVTHSNDPNRLIKESEGAVAAEAVAAVLENSPVFSRLSRIRESQLFAVHLFGAEHALKDVVRAYNRINSAGKRVEAEERIFARLVSVHPKAESNLKSFFDRIHPHESANRARTSLQGTEGAIEVRDDLVRREREGQFGFKLFMRTFVIALSYHADRAISSSSFSFNSVGLRDLERASAHLDEILESTVGVLSSLATILREQLHCDDFRMVPDTSSLWPVLQAMFRFPGLARTHQAHLGVFVLKLILADPTNRQILTLVDEVNEARDSAEALTIFERGPLDQRRLSKAIREGVNDAQSLTSRYALMLYWLLRKKKAKDFSYKTNLEPEKARRLRDRYSTKTEPAISERVNPERQHIVPYKILKEVFKLSGSRPGRHEVHDLGNLTHISQGLNGFSDGLGSQTLRLRKESESNLAAHLLSDSAILEAFERACQRHTPATYRNFCSLRRKHIVESFIDWVTEAADAGKSRRVPRVEAPTRRLIVPRLEDRVRDFGYAPALTTHLVELVDLGLEKWSNGSEDDEEFRLALRYASRQQRLRLDLVRGGGRMKLKLKDARLKAKVKKQFPNLSTTENKNALICSMDTANRAGVRKSAKILEWLRNECAKTSGR